MATFHEEDLRGAVFARVDLREAQFRAVDLRGADLRGVVLHGARMRGVELVDVEISGEISNVSVNGVDIGPLVEAELDRRDPERVAMRPSEPSGYRRAWSIIERRWADTVTRARRLDPGLLHASVDGEWSFIETQRHLVFATDAWVRRAVLGEPAPWHPLDLPWDEMPDAPGVPRDRAVRPGLEEVLALRRDRMATVRQLIEDLTEEQLERRTEPVDAPGWPPARSYTVAECLQVVLSEEWEHRNYAERDLAILLARQQS